MPKDRIREIVGAWCAEIGAGNDVVIREDARELLVERLCTPEPNTLPLIARFIEKMNPGTPDHLAVVLRGHLEPKGVATEQEWDGDSPRHRIVVEVSGD